MQDLTTMVQAAGSRGFCPSRLPVPLPVQYPCPCGPGEGTPGVHGNIEGLLERWLLRSLKGVVYMVYNVVT